jgi:hypothetical protein
MGFLMISKADDELTSVAVRSAAHQAAMKIDQAASMALIMQSAQSAHHGTSFCW